MRSLGLALAIWLLAANGVLADGPFSNWAAIVVAGDWHAHSGAPSEVFDNARRDLTKAFIAAGVSPANISQFSVRPGHYPKETVLKSAPEPVYDHLMALAKQAPDGCLIYFTSHGAPEGVVVDDGVWDPVAVAQMIGAACGERPTVVVVSACFSGVFAPALEGPNRMILTAARADQVPRSPPQNRARPPSGHGLAFAAMAGALLGARRDFRCDYWRDSQRGRRWL